MGEGEVEVVKEEGGKALGGKKRSKHNFSFFFYSSSFFRVRFHLHYNMRRKTRHWRVQSLASCCDSTLGSESVLVSLFGASFIFVPSFTGLGVGGLLCRLAARGLEADYIFR